MIIGSVYKNRSNTVKMNFRKPRKIEDKGKLGRRITKTTAGMHQQFRTLIDNDYQFIVQELETKK